MTTLAVSLLASSAVLFVVFALAGCAILLCILAKECWAEEDAWMRAFAVVLYALALCAVTFAIGLLIPFFT